MPIS
ncbi:hypothetical protein D047_3952A, partial [Vibrio parahaemolyticus VPTS-2010_2]